MYIEYEFCDCRNLKIIIMLINFWSTAKQPKYAYSKMALWGGSYNAILLAISFNNSGITAWMVYAQKKGQYINMYIYISIWIYSILDQVWSIWPALELLPLDCWRGVSNREGATPMQAKWIKLDLSQYTQKFITATSLTALTVPSERNWH